MTNFRDPETMTSEERRLEVASILAGGLLRRLSMANLTHVDGVQEFSAGQQNPLDLPGETRLSVAQRPHG